MRNPGAGILAVLFALLCCGPAACRSTIGDGQIRSEKIVSEVEAVEDAVNRSAATPEEKRELTDRLRRLKPSVRQLGDDVDRNQDIAISNEAAAKAMRLVIALVSLVVIGLALYLWRSKRNAV